MCHENTQVKFEFCSDGKIFGRVIPLRLKIQINSGCHSLISVIHGHFQLKFGIYMCLKTKQVKFRYDSI